MSVTVRTTSDSYVYEDGQNFTVNQSGHLTVFDRATTDANVVASFASGQWNSAEMTGSSKTGDGPTGRVFDEIVTA